MNAEGIISNNWPSFKKPIALANRTASSRSCVTKRQAMPSFLISSDNESFCIRMDNPMIFSEFEKQANGILINFRVQDQALMDIITGQSEPSGLLPMQMPSDMSTVEKQAEDVPQDMKCHTDTEGSVYDFGFGMNWKGVIKDARVVKFKK